MKITITSSLERPDGQKIKGDKPLKYKPFFDQEKGLIVVNLMVYVSQVKLDAGYKPIREVNEFTMRQNIPLTPKQFEDLSNNAVANYIFEHMEKILGTGFVTIE